MVTPICAHSLHSPSIVFAADRRITIRGFGRLGSRAAEQRRRTGAGAAGGGAVQVELLDRCEFITSTLPINWMRSTKSCAGGNLV